MILYRVVIASEYSLMRFQVQFLFQLSLLIETQVTRSSSHDEPSVLCNILGVILTVFIDISHEHVCSSTVFYSHAIMILPSCFSLQSCCQIITISSLLFLSLLHFLCNAAEVLDNFSMCRRIQKLHLSGMCISRQKHTHI